MADKQKITLPAFLTKRKQGDPIRMTPEIKKVVEKSERGHKLDAKERRLLEAFMLQFPRYDINDTTIARVMNALRTAEQKGTLPKSGVEGAH